MNELRTFMTKKKKYRVHHDVFTLHLVPWTLCFKTTQNLMLMVKTNFQSLPEFINVFLFLLLLLFFQSNTKILPLLSKSCLPIFHLSSMNGSMLTSGRQWQVIRPNSWSWVQVPPCLHGFLLHVGRRTKSTWKKKWNFRLLLTGEFHKTYVMHVYFHCESSLWNLPKAFDQCEIFSCYNHAFLSKNRNKAME